MRCYNKLLVIVVFVCIGKMNYSQTVDLTQLEYIIL